MKYNGSFNIDDEAFQKEIDAFEKSKKWDKWLMGISMGLGANIILIYADGGAVPTVIGGGVGYYLIKLLVGFINKSYWSYKTIKLAKLGILAFLIVCIAIVFSFNPKYAG